MISSINTSSYINAYRQQTINARESLASTIKSTSHSFIEDIYIPSGESPGKTEDLWGEFKTATSGMGACTKCGALYMGQEPPAICGKCGNKVKSGEDESTTKVEKNTKTNAASGTNNNLSTLSELDIQVPTV